MFEVELARSNITVRVPPGVSILDAVRALIGPVMSSCEEGICSSCETAVLAGVLPFLEDLVEAGVFLVALMLAVPLTLITIALAWFAHRPLIGALLIVAGIAFVLLIGYLRRAAPGRPQPTP